MKDYSFSFLRISEKDEIDLIVERPGSSSAVIEIKSSEQISDRHVNVLKRLQPDFPNAEFFILSRDESPKLFGDIKARHWKSGIEEIIQGSE